MNELTPFAPKDILGRPIPSWQRQIEAKLDRIERNVDYLIEHLIDGPRSDDRKVIEDHY